MVTTVQGLVVLSSVEAGATHDARGCLYSGKDRLGSISILALMWKCDIFRDGHEAGI